MKTLWSILALALAVVPGCSGNGGPNETAPATVEVSQDLGPVTALPNEDGSLKFAVIGDFGTGKAEQYRVAGQMARFRETFPFEMVITVGDNLYGRQRAGDFRRKFEDPYKALLDAGVKFYAALGNHDIREQPSYKLFNMEGELYYTHKAAGSVKFFFLDTSYLTPEQREWVEKELSGSDENWKIAVFHHPLYSSGGRHGSDQDLRQELEPLFVEHNVSIVFQGHDHFYERIKPQKGIVYFVAGSSGKLSPGDIDDRSPLTARGFDTARVFMAVEIHEDRMYFNAVTDTGRIIDSGIIERRLPVDDDSEPEPRAPPPANTGAASQPHR